HKQVGAFRPLSEISDGDGREYAVLPLQPAKEYTLLLEVHHTKYYQPEFDFQLRPNREFFARLRFKESLNAALIGATFMFFLYSLLSWAVSRYRPYAWLMLFIGGIGIYVVGSGGYIMEWFYPENPASGWLLNIQFLHLGMFGMYLLVVDFWDLPGEFSGLYRRVRWIPAILVVTSVACFVIDYFAGNYRLAGIVEFSAHPILLGFVGTVIVTCWPRLTSSQRYLAYGMALCGLAGIFITTSIVFRQERTLSSAGLVSDFLILTVFLLFSMGLKEEMRQNELAKQAALRELNRLQQHQNSILEKKVEERTEELRISNKRLVNQKYQLAERNSKIETLINELNHRVKNNLQLLYSLISLQLPLVKDGVAREILKGNIGKIRAMMLVNQKLFGFERGQSVGLCEFVTELGSHLQKIYDNKEKTRIQQDIPATIRLSDKHTLSFGLILSELFTNTFKHAFRDQSDPCIQVKAIAVSDRTLEFIYSDNGVGMQKNGNDEKFTMGIPLIRDLTRQLNGEMKVASDRGLRYSFTIPV
ncbi:MAG TPA: histidine kinase dimerization/phosphoacceptor domain -containing protein, partial [Puia sp.]|nr:histidine kinase dimerization/phosphoacceptor domain -containing protein [Puia sp.]